MNKKIKKDFPSFIQAEITGQPALWKNVYGDWGKENFAQSAIAQIKRGMDNGAIGVKMWKDIGFDYRIKMEIS